jgi:protein-tyrosine-phosphatase
LAAGLFSAETEGLSVEVSSLGTLDLGPVPALPEAVTLAAELRLDLGNHRARQLGDLRDCDLVVGFERKHVTAAVVDGGAAVERTFTLRELVDLLRGLSAPPGDARERIAEAHAARPPDFRNQPLPEIRDPLGLPAPEQRAVARAVEDQVSKLTAALFD